MIYNRLIKEGITELLQDFRIVYLTGPRQSAMQSRSPCSLEQQPE